MDVFGIGLVQFETLDVLFSRNDLYLNLTKCYLVIGYVDLSIVFVLRLQDLKFVRIFIFQFYIFQNFLTSPTLELILPFKFIFYRLEEPHDSTF